MSSKYQSILNSSVPQTEPLNSAQIKNNAGGYGYKIADLEQVKRFILLGTLDTNYYVAPRKLTQLNIDTITKVIKTNGLKVVEMLTEIDTKGQAPKKTSTLYTLALCIKHGNEETRSQAYSVIPLVCRTGSHLFELVQLCDELGKGWGRGLKRAVGNWYKQEPNKLAYQVIKYRQRNGYTHKDLVKLSHPRTDSPVVNWVIKGTNKDSGNIPIISAYEFVNSEVATTAAICTAIEQYNLPREALPTTVLNHADVWQALLQKMPTTALVRSLGKITALGLLDKPQNVTLIEDQLTNPTILEKARIHPLSVLVASKVYSSGRGIKGDLIWNPNQRINAALSDSFNLSFGALPKSNIRTLVAIDISGSMRQTLANYANMYLLEVAGCMSLATVYSNPNSDVVAFSHGTDIRKLDVYKRRLDDVYKELTRAYGGGTDCGLPLQYAINAKGIYDLIVMYTDNETWAGKRQVMQLWEDYKKINPKAKAVIVAMTPTHLSMFPEDTKDILQVVGFDSNLPNIISAFVGEEVLQGEEVD